MDRAYPSAEHLSANYQVLVWDRRNTGASDLAIEDAPSEVHLWADDLHHLLGALNMSPAYLGGTSNGQMLSLLMAHRYPQDVRGLILANTPTDDLDLMGRIWNAHYMQLAEVAESKGMQAVIAHSTEAQMRVLSAQSKPEDFDWLLSWVAETISMNPSNRDRLLATDPRQFSTLMRKWGRSILSGRPHLAGLTEDQVRCISVPALVAHGFNPFHPRRAAETLYWLLPNAEWVEYTDRFTQKEIDQAQDKGTLRRTFVEAFLRRNEYSSLDK
jgi:pimeloyl-ACP methyl ester carboxylesterase